MKCKLNSYKVYSAYYRILYFTGQIIRYSLKYGQVDRVHDIDSKIIGLKISLNIHAY